MVSLFQCRVCGEPYIGLSKPSRCPFCGAFDAYFVEAKDYAENFDVDLSEKDKGNVQKALEIEISNSAFYNCAAHRSDGRQAKELFRALAKVEQAHASIWRKTLKLPEEEMKLTETCSTKVEENLKGSHDRETKAIQFYKKAAAEAESKRVRMIFSALVHVEMDHLQFSK